MKEHYYRLYTLKADGGISGAANRSFKDDAEAFDFAGGLLEDHPGVEIWQTDRLVGRLDRDSVEAPGRDAQVA